MRDQGTLFDMIRFYRPVVEMLVLKRDCYMIAGKNRHRVPIKPSEVTLGCIATPSDSYKNPSTDALNIIYLEYSYPKKIPIAH